MPPRAFGPFPSRLNSFPTQGRQCVAQAANAQVKLNFRPPVLSIDDPRSGLTRWTYNARGDMKSRTNATGDTVTWKHDPLGRVTAVTDPVIR